MLDVPVKQKAGTEPPCFRCLFDKPVPQGWCDPATCEMLDGWLMDNDFSWAKYESIWKLNLELQNVNKYHTSLDEVDLEL